MISAKSWKGGWAEEEKILTFMWRSEEMQLINVDGKHIIIIMIYVVITVVLRNVNITIVKDKRKISKNNNKKREQALLMQYGKK